MKTTSDCDLAPALTAGQATTVSGHAQYDFVPATFDPTTGSGGLDFAHSELRPIREAAVEVRQCGTVLGTTITDANGAYSVAFTPGAKGQLAIYVLASWRPGSYGATPRVEVQDNANQNALWAVAQPIQTASPTVDVHATHGWTGATYGPNRIAAPFAILDSMYTAERRLLDIPRDVAFDAVPLKVNWSPSNSPAPSSIGTSYYNPSIRQIFVLGADGQDTDEFDREVIVHEWGHYFEDNFSRSDSIGGQHGLGDVLDPRLAFDEGYASAFAAILLNQRIYADTYWSGAVLRAFGWDVEPGPPSPDDPAPNAFSELSVIRAVWDFYDDVSPNGIGNLERFDTAVVPLAAIYDTLVGPQRVTKALTTLASFVTGLKQTLNDATASQAIDNVLANYNIGPITSEWGDGDSNLRGTYTNVPDFSAGPVPQYIVLDGSRAWNERAQNQYYVFTANGTHATVVATSNYDVDLYAYEAGGLLAVDDLPYNLSQTANIAFATIPGHVYVVWLSGWGGISSNQPQVGTYSVTVTFSN